jgi:segregation and condensation protein B
VNEDSTGFGDGGPEEDGEPGQEPGVDAEVTDAEVTDAEESADHSEAAGSDHGDTHELPPLPAALEAVLLVTDEPVPAVTLAQVTERPTEEVEQTLRLLAADYLEAGRGFELRNVAGGWRLYTRPDCAPYVERFVLDGQSARLTQAALETLAVIAYRQPVTRSRVSAVRGVNVDGVVRTLLARGLITESGQDDDTGGILYRTTPMLLERLGLQSLEELPSLAPLLPELEDIDVGQPST